MSVNRKNKKLKAKKKKATLGSKQYISREVQMPISLMEQLFKESDCIGFETSEEAEYRLAKERYNRDVLRKIKKLKLTDRQREVLDLMYGSSNLNLRETAEKLGVIITTVQTIRDAAFRKIRKVISYDFKHDQEPL